MKFIGASYISSYFFSKRSFDFVNNKSISYNIYSCIIQIVKDHVVFWPVFLPLPVKYRVGERDRKLHYQHHFHSNQHTRNCLAKWTFVRSFTPNIPVVNLVMFSAKMEPFLRCHLESRGQNLEHRFQNLTGVISKLTKSWEVENLVLFFEQLLLRRVEMLWLRSWKESLQKADTSSKRREAES